MHEIERTQGRTEVIVDEGVSLVHYALDESLIAFECAVEDGDLYKAVNILETAGRQSTEADAMWTRLQSLAMEEENFRVAERCVCLMCKSTEPVTMLRCP